MSPLKMEKLFIISSLNINMLTAVRPGTGQALCCECCHFGSNHAIKSPLKCTWRCPLLHRCHEGGEELFRQLTGTLTGENSGVDMPLWKPNPADRLEPTWVRQTKQWEWSTNREAETGQERGWRRSGRFRTQNSPPVFQTSHFLFAALRSNLHLKTKDFHLVSGVSETLQRPIGMSPSPLLFLVERDQQAERSGALRQEKPPASLARGCISL